MDAAEPPGPRGSGESPDAHAHGTRDFGANCTDLGELYEIPGLPGLHDLFGDELAPEYPPGSPPALQIGGDQFLTLEGLWPEPPSAAQPDGMPDSCATCIRLAHELGAPADEMAARLRHMAASQKRLLRTASRMLDTLPVDVMAALLERAPRVRALRKHEVRTLAGALATLQQSESVAPPKLATRGVQTRPPPVRGVAVASQTAEPPSVSTGTATDDACPAFVVLQHAQIGHLQHQLAEQRRHSERHAAGIATRMLQQHKEDLARVRSQMAEQTAATAAETAAAHAAELENLRQLLQHKDAQLLALRERAAEAETLQRESRKLRIRLGERGVELTDLEFKLARVERAYRALRQRVASPDCFCPPAKRPREEAPALSAGLTPPPSLSGDSDALDLLSVCGSV